MCNLYEKLETCLRSVRAKTDFILPFPDIFTVSCHIFSSYITRVAITLKGKVASRLHFSFITSQRCES